MDDVTLIVVVLAVAIGGLAGAAYLLDRRRKVSGAIGPELPEPGPVGRALQWVIRGLVAVMVLSIVGVFAFKAMLLAWVAAGCLLAYVVLGRVLQIVRASGK